MIRHIVLFKIAKEYQEEVPGLIAAFLAMKGNVPCLADLMVGEDFLHSPRSYDVALIADFHSKEDMEAYQVHPLHVPAKTRMAQISEKVAAADFEF